MDSNVTPYDWLNKDYSFYMGVVVIISDGSGLRIEVSHRNQPDKSKLSLYKLLTFFLNGCTQATRQRGRCGGCRHIVVQELILWSMLLIFVGIKLSWFLSHDNL